MRFNIEVNPTDSWVAVLQPFPKTDIWQQCLDRGLITRETECRTFTDDTALDFPQPTREMLNRLAKWWYHAVKWRLDSDTVLDLISIPLAQEQKRLIQEARWKEAARVLYEM